ncbi:MAG TPA: GTPase HflX [Desulfurococcales archaeon]|nr:GTPase HflX [Desulfurococcales archaeon]
MKRAIILSLNANSGEINEIVSLAKTAGYNIVKLIVQNRRNPDSRYYIGKGKVREVKELIKKLGLNENDKVIVNAELKPTQAYNLMKEFNIPVIDRVQLILEIFAQHAGSKEAKLQIELAKLKYEIPFIREYIRLSKLNELPGFLGGGGYEIDSIYYTIKRRINRIEREIKKIRQRRQLFYTSRRNMGIPIVTLTGYTCAGKTSIFNRLVNENKPVDEKPFTTLSPKSKALLNIDRKVIVVDTVGFIDKVPVQLIEAFYSTLEEVINSNLILLVVDISEDRSEIKRKVIGSFRILSEIGVVGIPIIILANKIDKVKSKSDLTQKIEYLREIAETLYDNIIDIIPVSAITGENIDKVIEKIKNTLFPEKVKLKVIIDYESVGKLHGLILTTQINGDKVLCETLVPKEMLPKILDEIKKLNGLVVKVEQ